MSNIASYYCVKPDKLRRHYKRHSSNFNDWEQKKHAEEYLIFNDNIGEYLSLDETSLSQGEIYTYLTNKSGKGKKKTLVACIKGTKANDISDVINKIPLEERLKVKEVTLDMARNVEAAVLKSFPNASIVTDRFHVVKLVLDAVQHLRIKLRWKAIDNENEAIKEAKEKLAKKEAKWTVNQKQRALILFREFPQLKKAYNHCMKLRNIYENTSKSKASQLLEQWIKDTDNLEIKEFNTSANSIIYNKENILNFFHNRSTNANAESFNSKLNHYALTVHSGLLCVSQQILIKSF